MAVYIQDVLNTSMGMRFGDHKFPLPETNGIIISRNFIDQIQLSGNTVSFLPNI